MADKVKPITLTDNETGEKYVLEFSRDSVKFAEQRGFDIDDVKKYPMTKVPELFFYAFRMHHKSISLERANRILFDDLHGLPEGTIERLINLYIAPFDALIDTSDEGDEKNARMTVEL